ncbi:protein-L-isoaspartate carboxylmethyltransferase [Bowdeniella nasicola]|uniref:Protein-L-isoaspartate O-methyltransferase n=1 Tax=Bowdeniella nasicola TaxID=208480 RepID=A0A1Q5Q1V0_9ACTO|nr:protein-L-isoaspartate O-methyltransferase [Bowdeniella nasicola]OKL53811.1 protein-L-isoaspartate carboxylmethyltransferase [Bowdeniella nasicola]
MSLARTREAFAATPRGNFLPPELKGQAHWDMPVPIGFSQTNSQPRTVADMLELLDVPTGARVLDVGSGSGWTTALLAHLVGEGGQVIGVELIAELVEFGRANLATASRPWAEIRQATPGVLGVPEEAPYDRILVSASPRELPRELVDQLAPGGIMAIPVGHTMYRISKDADGNVEESTHGAYTFVPLH